MKRLVTAAVGLTVSVAAWSSTGGTAARENHASARQVEAVASTTTTDPLDRYNPEHDPNTCVRLLDDANVAITIVEPVPPGTPMNPAAANEPITPVPPLGKCG
jgi:hypothetical protein